MRERTSVLRLAGALAAFAVALCFLLWKCRYGFANSDEAFYLSVPLRLCRGDALLAEEWHGTQLSGLLLYPLMALYRLCFGASHEGMLLRFRYLYTLLHTAASLFLWRRWRRLSSTGALPAALVYLLFVPFGIPALSYNSMGLGCLTLSMTLLATARDRRNLQQVLAGVLFAGAVLCYATAAALYLLYGLAVLALCLGRRDRGEGTLSLGCLLRFTGGCALLALALAMVILPRAGLSRVVSALPYILQDPEHPSGMLGRRLTLTAQYLFWKNPAIRAGTLGLGLSLGLSLGDRSRRWLWWLTGTLSALALLWGWMDNNQLINALTFPVGLLGLLAPAADRDRETRRVFWYLCLPGFLYGWCTVALSNQYFYNVQTGMALTCAGAVLILPGVIRRLTPEGGQRRIALVLAAAVLMGLFVQGLVWRRYHNVFWEKGIETQTELLTQGPEAGLRVSPGRQRDYEQTREEVERLMAGLGHPASAAVVTTDVWCSLLEDWSWGAYSYWLSPTGGNVQQRLLAYYRLNPGKVPEVILLDRRLEQDWTPLAQGLGWTLRRGEGRFDLLVPG